MSGGIDVFEPVLRERRLVGLVVVAVDVAGLAVVPFRNESGSGDEVFVDLRPDAGDVAIKIEAEVVGLEAGLPGDLMFFFSCVTVKSRRRTSVTASTVVFAVEESLDGTGSVSERETVAVFVTVPVALACTITSTNCELPTSRAPSEQAIVVGVVGRLLPHAPMLGAAEMKPTCAGSASLMVTFVAMAGPLLVTVRR
jgi:hypothetical protein